MLRSSVCIGVCHAGLAQDAGLAADAGTLMSVDRIGVEGRLRHSTIWPQVLVLVVRHWAAIVPCGTTWVLGSPWRTSCYFWPRAVCTCLALPTYGVPASLRDRTWKYSITSLCLGYVCVYVCTYVYMLRVPRVSTSVYLRVSDEPQGLPRLWLRVACACLYEPQGKVSVVSCYALFSSLVRRTYACS